ncbi:hypothetical protein KW882_00985 [Vibrio parahaemolyticus]
MKIQLFVRNDISMPLGKICAQCAHALNKAVLDRLSARQTEQLTTLSPTNQLRDIISRFNEVEISIEYGDLDHILSSAESDTAFIRDRGRTVFNEPTITVSWATSGWGEPVTDSLPFNSGDIPFKQPIFVNRSNKLVDESDVIKAAASASTTILVSLSDEKGNIKLKNDDPMLSWLQNGFGKTVVGCKKASHFDSCIAKLRDEQGFMNTEVSNDKGTFLLAHYPISSEVIELYTRNKYTRLLDNL